MNPQRSTRALDLIDGFSRLHKIPIARVPSSEPARLDSTYIADAASSRVPRACHLT